jgi:hypothetical protein
MTVNVLADLVLSQVGVDDDLVFCFLGQAVQSK